MQSQQKLFNNTALQKSKLHDFCLVKKKRTKNCMGPLAHGQNINLRQSIISGEGSKYGEILTWTSNELLNEVDDRLICLLKQKFYLQIWASHIKYWSLYKISVVITLQSTIKYSPCHKQTLLLIYLIFYKESKAEKAEEI